MPLVLPPGFQARLTDANPWTDAIDAAPTGQPGTVFWSPAAGLCRAAVLLAPDRPVTEGVIINLGLLAVLDAVAVLAPPHVPLNVALPATVLVDGAAAATIRSVTASGEAFEGVPAWAILGFDIAVSPRHDSPGDTPDHTSLHEEGFGDVTPAEVLQHVCRHLLGWIDVWHDDGDAVLPRALAQYLPRQAAA